MTFWIQVGSPLVKEVDDEPVLDMSDALVAVYPDDTEYLIISWNRVPVIVSYADDLRYFLYEIVDILEQLQDRDFRDAEMLTGAADFFAEWQFRADGDDLVIDSRWERIVGGYEFLLNERSQLTLPRADFVAEWMKVIRRVVEDITAQAVRMEDESLFARAKALLAAVDADSDGLGPGSPGHGA